MQVVDFLQNRNAEFDKVPPIPMAEFFPKRFYLVETADFFTLSAVHQVADKLFLGIVKQCLGKTNAGAFQLFTQ